VTSQEEQEEEKSFCCWRRFVFSDTLPNYLRPLDLSAAETLDTKWTRDYETNRTIFFKIKIEGKFERLA
jgi:hypothetical protein